MFTNGSNQMAQTTTNQYMDLYGITNLEMEKRRLMELDTDPTSFICVDPYEVNPITEMSNIQPQKEQTKVSPSVSPQNAATTDSGVFYAPQGRIKLEMEEFSDLSLFVLPRPTSINATDELSTPVFDKDAFDFGMNNNNNNQLEETFVKLEYDYYDNIFKPESNTFKDNFVNTRTIASNSTGRMNRNENTTSGDLSSHRHTIASKPESESAYKILPSYENTRVFTCNVDDHLNNYSESYHSNVSSPDSLVRPSSSGMTTPDDVTFSNETSLNKSGKKLSLNVNVRIPTNNFDLTTPSIIDEVVDLENLHFNILDLVDEDINLNTEEILNLSSVIPKPPVENNQERVTNQKRTCLAKKKPKRRKIRDDDDEDYIPPSKRKVVQFGKNFEDFSDSGSDSEVEIEVKPKPNARFLKRTGSISSECSKDSDASKYRELRDKNNEASRKSRLKRKLKDVEMEKEADELNSRNIKLKAQVEELEKMVTNFRDNLFKIMIKK